MDRIKITKNVTYYLKKRVTQRETVDTFYASSVDEAKEIIKNYDLHYVKNVKGISAFESINAFVSTGRGQFTNYFKDRNFDTLEEWMHV